MDLWRDIPNFEGLYQASSTSRKVIRDDGKIYNSIKEAKKDLKKPHAHIVEVCQGKLKSVYGFKFKYLEAENV